MARISRPTKPLADVNCLPQKDGSHEIVACFLPDPYMLVGEGKSRACLAVDASASMKSMFGFSPVPFNKPPNYVEAVARKIGAILCGITKSGKVAGLYWATSADGSKTEAIGEFDEAGWNAVTIGGPKRAQDWGRGTKLLPPVKHIVENIDKDSDWTMGVVITDGIIEDEKDVIDYCMRFGQDLEKKWTAGTRKKDSFKFVLIGIGEEVDEAQFERLNDMFEDSPLEGKVDLWACGMVASMQEEADILAVLFGELMSEELIVSQSGSVADGSGKEICKWPDGVPGKFRFMLPKGEKSFTVHIPGQDITQDCSEAIGKP